MFIKIFFYATGQIIFMIVLSVLGHFMFFLNGNSPSTVSS